MDYHEIPRFSDRWSYLYLEKGQLDRDKSSAVFHQGERDIPVPINQFSTVMLGPGVTITAAAAKLFAEYNCLLCWCGEDGMKFYAHGIGGTHSSERLLQQAKLYANTKSRMAVARRMFAKYLGTPVSHHLSLQQMRGMEGARVRKRYKEIAEQTGVTWNGRHYDQGNWDWADPVNRSLSVANACLHSLCHAAILSAGYSPAIAFVHTGKMLSFVYDVADFYKSELTVAIAFHAVAESTQEIERRTRARCRREFFSANLMNRILPDIAEVLDACDHLEERPGELEGRAVSLADRTGGRSVPGQSVSEDSGSALEEDRGEGRSRLRDAGVE